MHIGHLVLLEWSNFACVARIEWRGEKSNNPLKNVCENANTLTHGDVYLVVLAHLQRRWQCDGATDALDRKDGSHRVDRTLVTWWPDARVLCPVSGCRERAGVGLWPDAGAGSVKALVCFWLIDETLSANLVYQDDYEIGSTTPSDEAMAKIMTMVMAWWWSNA